MIRIPGSFNSKCILEGKDPEVRIIQTWDGYRPKINLLLGKFHTYVVNQTIKELQRQKELKAKHQTKKNDNDAIPELELVNQSITRDSNRRL